MVIGLVNEVARHFINEKTVSFFKQRHLDVTKTYYTKYGGHFTLILARFIPIIRTFAPILGRSHKSGLEKFYAVQYHWRSRMDHKFEWDRLFISTSLSRHHELHELYIHHFDRYHSNSCVQGSIEEKIACSIFYTTARRSNIRRNWLQNPASRHCVH